MDNTAIKRQYSSVTVEFPIDDEFVELDTQIMFEMVRQLVAKGVGCDPEKVWIKSVSHITQLDQAPSPPGISCTLQNLSDTHVLTMIKASA